MRIEYDIKLGFKDVMFRPKRSTLKSRSQVSLEREFTFKNSKKTWTGVPIIAANMDTVGTFEMATALAEEKIITAIHKHYTLEEWSAFLENSPESIYQYIAISSGTGSSDEEKIKEINRNYLVPMMKLYEHYQFSDDNKRMKWIKEKLQVISRGTEDENFVQKFLAK